jgi:hypothetical protein
MRRFIIPALLGVFLLTSAAPAQYFPNSPERLVRNWYRQYLGRDLDQGGSGWVSLLENGASPDVVLASILGSDEYWQRAGGTPDGFVRALYMDLGRREPTRRDYDYWIRRLQYEQPSDVALGILHQFSGGWQRSTEGEYGVYRPRPPWRYRR